MNQPPRYQKTPETKRKDRIWITIALVLGVFFLIWTFTRPSHLSTTADNTINSYPPPSNNDASYGAGSHTNTYFYSNTATPTQGVNGNPYGYDFNPTNGNEIYDEIPGDFCHYFKCTSDFWSNRPLGGYVVECQDGYFSHTGGTKYACQNDGGVKRILYWH
jgi:hypothetical protein